MMDNNKKKQSNSSQPSNVVIVVGTYEGVLGGWEHVCRRRASKKKQQLKLTMATSVHQGSIRSLSLLLNSSSSSTKNNDLNKKENDDTNVILLSTGYDEMLKVHNWTTGRYNQDEIRTPSDMGTPLCSTAGYRSCLVGFAQGQIALYSQERQQQQRWTLQHLLRPGHLGGVASLAMHSSGKLALSGGVKDGKIKLWDLVRGRLAHVISIPSRGGKNTTNFPSIGNITWNPIATMYGYSFGNHITIRNVSTGNIVLDVELPSRINQFCFLGKDYYIAVACNDGSLAVLALQQEQQNDDDDDDENNQEDTTRRAIMAIEPVDRTVAGEERIKCIQPIFDINNNNNEDMDKQYLVVTANSLGVVSIMDLRGAINMLENNNDEEEEESASNAEEEQDDDDEEEELAVDIIESVQLGTGARITCLAAWSSNTNQKEEEEEVEEDEQEEEENAIDQQQSDSENEEKKEEQQSKKKRKHDVATMEMNDNQIKEARALVKQAKKIQRKKARKQKKMKKQQS